MMSLRFKIYLLLTGISLSHLCLNAINFREINEHFPDEKIKIASSGAEKQEKTKKQIAGEIIHTLFDQAKQPQPNNSQNRLPFTFETLNGMLTHVKEKKAVVFGCNTGELGLLFLLAGAEHVVFNDTEMAPLQQALKRANELGFKKSQMSFKKGDCLKLTEKMFEKGEKHDLFVARNVIHFLPDTHHVPFVEALKKVAADGALLNVLEHTGINAINTSKDEEFRKKILEQHERCSVVERIEYWVPNGDQAASNKLHRIEKKDIFLPPGVATSKIRFFQEEINFGAGDTALKTGENSLLEAGSEESKSVLAHWISFHAMSFIQRPLVTLPGGKLLDMCKAEFSLSLNCYYNLDALQAVLNRAGISQANIHMAGSMRVTHASAPHGLAQLDMGDEGSVPREEHAIVEVLARLVAKKQ